MTVRELIAELEKHDPELEVVVEVVTYGIDYESEDAPVAQLITVCETDGSRRRLRVEPADDFRGGSFPPEGP